MSHQALIEDLRQKSSARIEQIQKDVRARVERLQKEKNEEFERYEADVLGRMKDEADKIAAPILHEAQRSALEIEDEAMAVLSGKIYSLAKGMLEQIRDKDYGAFFGELVEEVPQINWEMVQVNPVDKELARRFFPGCVIEGDPEIIGGFVASTEGGKYRVVNTLGRRLEKGWPLIQPTLLRKILEEQDAAPAA